MRQPPRHPRGARPKTRSGRLKPRREGTPAFGARFQEAPPGFPRADRAAALLLPHLVAVTKRGRGDLNTRAETRDRPGDGHGDRVTGWGVGVLGRGTERAAAGCRHAPRNGAQQLFLIFFRLLFSDTGDRGYLKPRRGPRAAPRTGAVRAPRPCEKRGARPSAS